MSVKPFVSLVVLRTTGHTATLIQKMRGMTAVKNTEKKKFKITWREVEDGEWGQFSKHLEAVSEDEACEWWYSHVDPYVESTGIEDCVQLVESELFEKQYVIDMPDNLTYHIPVEFIARHRAEHYSKSDGVDFNDSLVEDTIPLFLSDNFEIQDWARNNMDWEDVKGVATAIINTNTKKDDFQSAWLENEVKVV